jgi:hypothetical protein
MGKCDFHKFSEKNNPVCETADRSITRAPSLRRYVYGQFAFYP